MKVRTLEGISAPINKGEKLGIAELYQNDRLIAKIDIVADRDIYDAADDNKSFFDIIKELLKI